MDKKELIGDTSKLIRNNEKNFNEDNIKSYGEINCQIMDKNLTDESLIKNDH